MSLPARHLLPPGELPASLTVTRGGLENAPDRGRSSSPAGLGVGEGPSRGASKGSQGKGGGNRTGVGGAVNSSTAAKSGTFPCFHGTRDPGTARSQDKYYLTLGNLKVQGRVSVVSTTPLVEV